MQCLVTTLPRSCGGTSTGTNTPASSTITPPVQTHPLPVLHTELILTQASLAGDLARILASVGACRREGLGIRDHVMEAFGEALVRVRDGMVHAQAGLGQEVRQSVAAHEEALAAVRERVSAEREQ